MLSIYRENSLFFIIIQILLPCFCLYWQVLSSLTPHLSYIIPESKITQNWKYFHYFKFHLVNVTKKTTYHSRPLWRPTIRWRWYSLYFLLSNGFMFFFSHTSSVGRWCGAVEIRNNPEWGYATARWIKREGQLRLVTIKCALGHLPTLTLHVEG